MTLLERVARALCREAGEDPDYPTDAKAHWQLWLTAARAAVEAMREPTEEMMRANVCMCGRSAWETMIDAALSEKP